MAGDSDADWTLGHLPKDEAGRPRRVPANYPPDVTEATVSVVGKMTLPITVFGAGQRNAWNVLARQTDVTEEATPHQTDRRAAPTEAGNVTVLKAKPPNAFQPPNAGVKPPRVGVATACSVAQSTLLTPRCGVGLNELLGGGGF